MPPQRPDLRATLVARPRTTGHLLAAGVTTHELTGPLWTPVVRGSHVWLGGDAEDPLVRIQAVAELMPAGAVVGGWAALYLLGVRDLDGRTGRAAATMLPVLVCVGPVGRMRRRRGIAVDRSTLLPEDVTEAQGIPVTTALRSCLDIMRMHGVEEGVVAGDAAGRFGVASPDAIQDFVASHPGMRGIPQARVAAPLVDAGAASCPESRLRVVWVLEAGLPVPLVNRGLVDEGGVLLGEPDLFDPEAAMAGEYDGSDHRTLLRHTSDNAREEGFERHNVTVVRATAIDLWPRRAHLVSRLRAGHGDGLARDRSRDRWGLRL